MIYPKMRFAGGTGGRGNLGDSGRPLPYRPRWRLTQKLIDTLSEPVFSTWRLPKRPA